MFRTALALAVIAAVFHLAARYAGWGWPALILKPAPVLCLAWLVYRHSRSDDGTGPAPRSANWLLFGLLFSALGDVILALPSAMDAAAGSSLATYCFMGGLGAFLIAHLFYVGWFLTLERRACFRVLPVPVVYAAVLLVILWPYLGAMLIPVLAYAVVITVMLWRALAAAAGEHEGRTTGEERAAVGAATALLRNPAAWGAGLFVLSDSLIAMNRFVAPIPAATLAIMLTYWAGQCGIFLTHRRRSPSGA